MSNHKHEWKRDATRTHGRPPRFFVVCQCGAKSQAVINYGSLHTFQTSRPTKPPDEIKKMRSVRLSDREMSDIESGKKTLTVADGRITIAV